MARAGGPGDRDVEREVSPGGQADLDVVRAVDLAVEHAARRREAARGRRKAARVRERHRAARAVAAHLGLAAVGIVVRHAEVGTRDRADDDEPVAADALAAVAQRGDALAGQPAGGQVAGQDHDEVVAGAVHLGEGHALAHRPPPEVSAGAPRKVSTGAACRVSAGALDVSGAATGAGHEVKVSGQTGAGKGASRPGGTRRESTRAQGSRIQAPALSAATAGTAESKLSPLASTKKIARTSPGPAPGTDASPVSGTASPAFVPGACGAGVQPVSGSAYFTVNATTGPGNDGRVASRPTRRPGAVGA